MTRYKLINGERIQFTAEEETIRDQEEAQAVKDKETRDAAKVVKDTNITSAKTKLQNLGLTIDEVKDAFNI